MGSGLPGGQIITVRVGQIENHDVIRRSSTPPYRQIPCGLMHFDGGCRAGNN